MKNYAILRDAIDEKVFGLVVENNGGYQFYGADQRSREWATWANSTSVKSLVGALPVGVSASQSKPLIHDSESFIEGLIESAGNNPTSDKNGFSFKGSHITDVASTTPSARDFQLRSFDINSRNNALTFKALAFKNDQKTSSLLAKMRVSGIAFNQKTGEFKTNNIAISQNSVAYDIDQNYTKSMQRHVGLIVTAAKTVHAKSQKAFYVHPSVVELKRLGGAIGPKLGRGLRSAPMGMVFVDVTGAIDADKDGIVFEGKPGLERPIVPKFILPEGVGRRFAKLISGTAEDNERNRRAGIPSNNAIDEGKLRQLLGSDAASLSSLTSQIEDVNDMQTPTAGMRSIAGNIRSRRDAIIGRRTSTDKLSRVGRGGKTQVNTGDSRAIEKMSWDDDAKDLIVTFAGGRTYTYKGVDDKWVKEIETNPDALGRIMNDIKKAGYDFEVGGEHAGDRTLASRSQGRREAAGMRSARTSKNNPLKQSEVDDMFYDNAAWSSEAIQFSVTSDFQGYDIESLNPLSEALYQEFPDRFNVDEGGKFGTGIPRHAPEVDFDYSNMSDEELGNFTDILAEHDPGVFDWIADSGTGMSSRKEPASPDATTDFDRIYEGVIDITGYDTELGPKGVREVANIINNRWKKATRKERQDYIASTGNATDGAIALASEEGLLDDFDLGSPVDSMTPNQRLGMSSRSARRLTGTTWDDKTPKDGTPTDDDPYQFDFAPDDLSGADLSGANLSNAELGSKNLAGAKLNDINGSKIDLTDADLTRANMDRSDMVGAEMAGANLEKASLIQANLTDANLRGANLQRAELVEATLKNADLREANLENAKLNAFLTDATLRGANLHGADMRDADLRGADLRDADLRDADLTGANLDGAMLTGADLDGAKLDKGWEQHVGMRSTRSTDARPASQRFVPDLGSSEDYIASDQYEQDLEAFLEANPRKTERDYRLSRAFADNFGDFNPASDFQRGRTSEGDYEGWTPDEIEAGIPEILDRGMSSRKTSNLTPEGKRDIQEATKKLSTFAKQSSFGDPYPGAEVFDKNNGRHQYISNLFEDADMPNHRVQDVLNAMQALSEVFDSRDGGDSDVGYSDRLAYALDHIAPTFDARLSLSKGARSGRDFGMGSRTATPTPAAKPGFTSRSRAATLERTAISSPTGMLSAKKATIYKQHDLVPGQQEIGPNDGQLWASLSVADRELFARRAKARESQIIEMLGSDFDIPITGTDRRLDDPTLSAAQKAKIIKATGGGMPWVVPNADADGYYLLNQEGLDNIFYGEYSVQRTAEMLARDARQKLESGDIAGHKKAVAKLGRLLRLSDDLQTLAGARIQGESDDSLINKYNAYDLAIDHIHPASKESIMSVGKAIVENDAPSRSKRKSIYELSGADSPFEFNFTTAHKRGKSTAIEVPGRPRSSKYDYMQQAGILNEDGTVGGKVRSKIGKFSEFLRNKFTDLSKSDQKAQERRIKKLRSQGVNVGSVRVGATETDRPSLLDKRAIKLNNAARKKLLNARPRSIEAITKSADDNNDTTPMLAGTEDGKTFLTPDGIATLASPLKVGEKEWRKQYRNKGKNNEEGHALAFVWQAAGMNGTPHTVNEEEYAELIKAGWRPIKRGTGTRGYGISYMGDPKRFLPPAGEAYGPGEYWSTGNNMSWTGAGYYPEPNGELGDGPGGLAGMLPPTAKIVTTRELESIRSDHRKFSSPILGVFAGYPKNGWKTEEQDNFIGTLTNEVFSKIPRDSEVWNTAMGQMTLQLIRAMESNPSAAEYAQLRDALFRMTSLVNQHENVYAPLFGFDAIEVGGDVVLLMNRAAVSVFADPLPVDAVVSLGRGNGLPSGFVPKGK